MFAVGRPVPAVPLYLTADEGGVMVPLEDTYAAAWPEVPAIWRAAPEGQSIGSKTIYKKFCPVLRSAIGRTE